jgi:hypothetical protein
VYVRGALNEALTFVFIPILFLCLKRASERKAAAVPLLAVAVGGLALTHNVINLFVFPWIVIFLLFIVYQSKRLQTVKLPGAGVLLGFLLSAYYWLPAIIEKVHTLIGMEEVNIIPFLDFHNNFITLSQLISPVWGYGVSSDKMPFQIGGTYLLAFAIAIASLRVLKDRVKKGIIFFAIGMTMFSIFMMLKWSQFLWDALPLIKNAQFPWRFLTLSTFSTAFLVGTLPVYLKEKPEWFMRIQISLLVIPSLILLLPLITEKGSGMTTFYIIALVVVSAGAIAGGVFIKSKNAAFLIEKVAIAMIILTALPISALPLHNALWGKPVVIDENKLEKQLTADKLRERIHTGTFGLISLPKTITQAPNKMIKNKVEVLNGDVELSPVVERSTRLHFTATAQTDAELLINTFYFPGWQIYTDGENMIPRIDFFGRMTFTIPPGQHTCDIIFEDTPIRRMSKLVSAISLFILCIWSGKMLLAKKISGI